MGISDIKFVETDTETIVNQLIAEYETHTGRSLYPADPVRVFILWIADVIVKERVLINEAAKENLPQYAKGEKLDALCGLFTGLKRLSASKASVTMKFWISAPRLNTVIIPKGSRVTADGSVYFATIENVYFQLGETELEKGTLVCGDCNCQNYYRFCGFTSRNIIF